MNFRNTIIISATLLLFIVAVFLAQKNDNTFLSLKNKNQGIVNELTGNKSGDLIHWVNNDEKAIFAEVKKKEDSKKNLNITDIVMSSMFSNVRAFDYSAIPDTGKFDVNDPKNKELLQKIINDSFGKGEGLFSFNAKESDIIISSDNSKESKSSYLGKMQKAYNDSGINSSKYKKSVEQMAKEINSDCFVGGNGFDKEMSNAYSKLGDEFIKIPVPSEWKETHIKVISYIKTLSLIYSGISSCYNDPIKGYLALNSFISLESSAGVISEELYKQGKEVNFNILF